MPISTNSIIHYTDSFDKLEKILKEGFAIKYCAEKLNVEGKIGSRAAHPMVSFCDIPLSQSYKHFKAYGKYGIGLSKKWANEMGINPVLYLESNSSISKTIARLLADRRMKSTKLNAEQKASILRIKCFAKNYSGHLKRKSIDNLNYRFYDEREWRLVPDKDILKGAPFSVNFKRYNTNKDKYNQRINSLRFKFEVKDISYIVVEKTTEIPSVIKILRTDYVTKCTPQKLDILFSSIVSTEQIISDY